MSFERAFTAFDRGDIVRRNLHLLSQFLDAQSLFFTMQPDQFSDLTLLLIGAG